MIAVHPILGTPILINIKVYPIRDICKTCFRIEPDLTFLNTFTSVVVKLTI